MSADITIDRILVNQLGSIQNGTYLTAAQTASLLNAGGGGSAAPGQAFYGFGSGQYTWTCPPGVTSVSVVCIGGGASSQGSTWSSFAGAGGGLGWKNNIAVTPGQTYTVQVGQGANGSFGVVSGSDSWFINSSLVRGGGGTNTTGGSFAGDGGGNGGGSGQYGGGGAGGYTGNGGGQSSAGSGGGAGGGASYSSTYGGASGGGTGPFGQGASGGAGGSGSAGQGGSGGENGVMGENAWYSYGVNGNRRGGLYGGGGGGTGTSNPGGTGFNEGARGCVRIIWGAGRSFPSTGTGDM